MKKIHIKNKKKLSLTIKMRTFEAKTLSIFKSEMLLIQNNRILLYQIKSLMIQLDFDNI